MEYDTLRKFKAEPWFGPDTVRHVASVLSRKARDCHRSLKQHRNTNEILLSKILFYEIHDLTNFSS